MRPAESQTDIRYTDKDALGTLAEYVCGLLDPVEHAQVHVLLGRDDRALSHALSWETELLALVDALPPAQPSPELRERLQRNLGIGPPPAPSSRQLLRRPSEERVSSAQPVAAAATVAATRHPHRTARHTTASPVSGNADSAKSRTHTETSVEATAHEPDRPKTSASHVAKDSPPTRAAAKSTTTPAPTAASETGRSTAAADAPPHAQPPAPAHAHVQTHTRTAREHQLGRKLWFWRLIGLTATAAAIVGFMLPNEPPPPPVQVVKVAPTRAAILQAPGSSSTPGWTATLDAQGNLIMQPLVQTEVPSGSQALLWTRSARIPEPRLLGAIDPNKPLQVPAERLGAIADDQLLEITLETDEDAANHVANGPILFIGQMTVFGAEGSVTPREGASGAAAAAQNGEGPYDTGSATSGPITQ